MKYGVGVMWTVTKYLLHRYNIKQFAIFIVNGRKTAKSTYLL